MKKSITVYEHQSLTLSHPSLTEKHLKALQMYYGRIGVPYFSLIHRGVRFNSFVGVLQVGSLTIEVLPKLDHQNDDSIPVGLWRSYLIEMRHYIGTLKVHNSESSFLKIQNNNLLHLYFELFVHQVEYLIHRGLIKKYRKTAD
nr:hypothetical protein [Bacteroidales bacterium]